MINSRILFRQLVDRLSIDSEASEKEAIIYLVLENQFDLSRIEVMKGKDIPENTTVLSNIIHRLNNNEPVQYVLGEADFFNRKFEVNPSVLIPRPETELIIELVGDYISKDDEGITIMDIGTGSGCIAVTIALEFPKTNVCATDISAPALDIAKRNSNGLGAKVDFKLNDILNSSPDFKKVDFIISNPPYIAEEEKNRMNKNVVDHEPALALFVRDSDPLVFYKAIAARGLNILSGKGMILVEINERFGVQTADVFRNAGYKDVEIIQDLDDKDRFVFARLATNQ